MLEIRAAGDTASWRTPEFLRDNGMRAWRGQRVRGGFAGQNINIGLVDSAISSGTYRARGYPIPDPADALTRRAGTRSTSRRHYRLYSRLLQSGLQR
jgi:subtilase-type serine protease